MEAGNGFFLGKSRMQLFNFEDMDRFMADNYLPQKEKERYFNMWLSKFSLAPLDRDVLTLHFARNWNFAEVGKYLGVGATTANKIYNQALLKIRSVLS